MRLILNSTKLLWMEKSQILLLLSEYGKKGELLVLLSDSMNVELPVIHFLNVPLVNHLTRFSVMLKRELLSPLLLQMYTVFNR